MNIKSILNPNGRDLFFQILIFARGIQHNNHKYKEILFFLSNQKN